MPRVKDENAKKQSFFQWLDLPKEQRFPPTYVEKARELHVTTQTLINWEKIDYPKWKKGNDGLVDISNMTHEQKVALWEKIAWDVFMGNKATAEDRKTIAKYLGLLIDKSEHKVNIELTGDDYTRIEQEARRRNIAEGYSFGENAVQEQPALLSEKIRENTG